VTSLSVFFKPDGEKDMYRGPLDGPLTDRYLRRGRYAQKKTNILTIAPVYSSMLLYADIAFNGYIGAEFRRFKVFLC
jgi:hypothetical protein